MGEGNDGDGCGGHEMQIHRRPGDNAGDGANGQRAEGSVGDATAGGPKANDWRAGGVQGIEKEEKK